MNELEMAKHMWKVYTKNVVRFDRVEIQLNSTHITITNYSNCGNTKICEFERFAEESEFINFVREDVASLCGETKVLWSGC